MPSSSAKCSAAKVGPNLSSSEPEYFFLIKLKRGVEISPACCDSRAARHSHAAALSCPSADTAATVFSPDGNSALASRPIAHLQIPTSHSPHDFHPLQLTTAHGCPLQQTSSGWRSH